MSERAREGYQGSTYDSIEQMNAFMEELGFEREGIIIWPDRPATLEETTDGLVWVEMPHSTPEAKEMARWAEEYFASLQVTYGLGNVIALPSPEDLRPRKSGSQSTDQKFVFVHRQ